MNAISSLNALPGDDWSVRLTKQTFRSILYYKEAMGLTTAELAKRVSETMEDPEAMKATTLNNLLAGKRKSITFSEILAFAYALGLPPIALMIPIAETGAVEALPGRQLTSLQFYDAIVGHVTYIRYNENPLTDEPSRTNHLLDLFEEYRADDQAFISEIGSLGHLLTTPAELEEFPKEVIESRRSVLADAAMVARASRTALRDLGINVERHRIAWLEGIEAKEITLSLIKSAYLSLQEDDVMGEVDGTPQNIEWPEMVFGPAAGEKSGAPKNAD